MSHGVGQMRRFACLVAIMLLSFTPAPAATLASPVTWGSPDQSWGRRRPVTAADRAAVELYRSGRKTPAYATNFSARTDFDEHWSTVRDDQNDAGTQSCRRPESVEVSGAGLRLKTLAASGCRHPWSTGYIESKARYGYGFYEATMKIADITGLNNAFWLTTDNGFEVDVAEVRYASYDHIGLQYWPRLPTEKHAGIGWGASFKDNLSFGFHDYGLLWTPTDMVFEIDGQPVAAVVIDQAVKGPATIRFSTMLANWAGRVPDNPRGHNMVIRSLRVSSP